MHLCVLAASSELTSRSRKARFDFLDSIDNSPQFKGVRHRENAKEGVMRRVLIKAGHVVSMDASVSDLVQKALA